MKTLLIALTLLPLTSQAADLCKINTAYFAGSFGSNAQITLDCSSHRTYKKIVPSQFVMEQKLKLIQALETEGYRLVGEDTLYQSGKVPAQPNPSRNIPGPLGVM